MEKDMVKIRQENCYLLKKNYEALNYNSGNKYGEKLNLQRQSQSPIKASTS